MEYLSFAGLNYWNDVETSLPQSASGAHGVIKGVWFLPSVAELGGPVAVALTLLLRINALASN